MKVAAMLCVVSLALSSCSPVPTPLQDGIYPVVRQEDAAVRNQEPIVELPEAPVTDSSEAPAQSVLVLAVPVLRFREVAHYGFKFDENNECTEIELGNTDSLRAFTRNHVGGRLAVVVDGKVVSSHKIRNPIETPNVTITFCTQGGGDELYRQLRGILPSSTE